MVKIKKVFTLLIIEELKLTGPPSYSFWYTHETSLTIWICILDTVLFKSRDMTGRSQKLYMAEGGGVKTTENSEYAELNSLQK
jgi:hypothetical protein